MSSLISATNAPINELINAGTFRQDLFYRIRTVEVRVPPLRERKEDIPALVSYFLDSFGKRYHRSPVAAPAVIDELCSYHWPGNVRELKHAVERAVILCKNPDLSIHDFQLSALAHSEHEPATLNLALVEKEIIRQALKKCKGNLTRASEELGIGRTTLYRKMEEYGIAE
jgi:two-component system, NtrC family, response regulator HydG